MKIRTINEEGRALCMCSEEDQNLLRENPHKCMYLEQNGFLVTNHEDELFDNWVYMLTLEEPETRREWLKTLPMYYYALARKRIDDAGNHKHLDDKCRSITQALGGYEGINNTFEWKKSNEGWYFWNDLAIGELPPIPQEEPECNSEYHKIDGVIYADLDHHTECIKDLEEKVLKLENKLASLWHIANAYDGDHIKACDTIMELCEDYVSRGLGR